MIVHSIAKAQKVIKSKARKTVMAQNDSKQQISNWLQQDIKFLTLHFKFPLLFPLEARFFFFY